MGLLCLPKAKDGIAASVANALSSQRQKGWSLHGNNKTSRKRAQRPVMLRSAQQPPFYLKFFLIKPSFIYYFKKYQKLFLSNEKILNFSILFIYFLDFLVII